MYENIGSSFIFSTSTEFWKKTSNFMTDAATKNLKVEMLVAEKLSCSHKPIHTLCKSHVVEKFHSTYLSVLGQLEVKMEFHQRIEAVNPNLKTFFCGKKAIVECGIYAMLNIVPKKEWKHYNFS